MARAMKVFISYKTGVDNGLTFTANTIRRFKDTEQRQDRGQAPGACHPIKGIILPIFGTGHGGRPAHEVLPALIQGIKEFLALQHLALLKAKEARQ